MINLSARATQAGARIRFGSIICLILCFCCFFILQPVFADDDMNNTKRRQVYHVLKDVDLIPTTKVKYAQPKIIIKATYPQLIGHAAHEDDENIAAFNSLVDALMQEEINDFKEQVAQVQTVQKTFKKSTIKNDLNIDFSTSIVNTNAKPIISMRFSMQGYITPQAHPYHRHRVINYDLVKGEELQLADLFRANADYLTVIADYCRKTLIKKFKDQQAMINEGTVPKAENYKNWNISRSGLIITFDEYQVAPYVYGTQTVLVPYSILSPLLVPDSLIAMCLKSRKRCLSNNLSTGGFMDEANSNPRWNVYEMA